MRIFSDCVYKLMVGEFELEGNESLGSLKKDRKFRMPTYMSGTFFVGLSTTQWSQSINSFFF